MKATTFLSIAYLISQESKCCVWKVGCVIAKNGRIISTGYNGTPAGTTNCCDHAKEQGWLDLKEKQFFKSEHRAAHSAWSAKHEIHAELNAILYAAKNGLSIDGATMYITLSPCPDCVKAITQSGIRQIVYCEQYDRAPSDWADLLKESGIDVVQIPKSRLSNLDWGNIGNYYGD